MENKSNAGKILLIVSFILTGLGVMLLFSASKGITSARTGLPVYIKQMIWVFLGSLLFIWLKNFDYRHWNKIAGILYFVCFILLLIVLATGTGRAGRWIKIGWLNFQPSEFTKFVLIILLARYFSTKDIEKFSTLLGGIIITGIPFLLILIQPNLGTAFLLIVIFFTMAYLAGARKNHLLILIIIGILMSPFLWMGLKDYQKQRLMVFVNPWKDPLGKGYNILQSKITIGSGGIIGKGFLRGTQTKLAFLPEYHTDFIFCLLAEEFGLVGVLVLLFLYYVFLTQIWKISMTTQDPFGRLIGMGVMVMFLIQIFVNIGMACGLLPVAGIPLPFLSYGGSALLVCFISLATVYNLHKNTALF
ncbi:MAG TPA: rod shape-determining protein RodA [Candidatus Ratteibacteria bacterium]|jgi:rod shape determining protein RodA|uniref:Rod shape-determining protein RodA n=1 Tax=candidate division TA06 bacterium ADurb.Bin131 TaxID=1852827 RepID=A0A1V6C4W9_UNCT6|nr:MAG: Rod shape-determining protein RodA [candidate division TA06 bacterium ADurb.Bin131]HON05452.1 rod shape-determining protein RodA [bacterium]HPC29733.1 rod shape-determining protein RodA [bacterium]HRS05822.1 rod shape-determining protein RodA [Candidatus Ratteibacteria bacterium]HRV03798.1 rod shape-determining protein RodA [Candidatus Ratteibacteria bacterium]